MSLSKNFLPSSAAADVPEGHQFMPLFDRLLVKEDELAGTTASGLLLPETNERPKPGRGVVTACGPGRFDVAGNWITVPPGVLPGVTVLFNQHAGVEVTINDEVFLMLNAGDLLGFVATPEMLEAARAVLAEGPAD